MSKKEDEFLKEMRSSLAKQVREEMENNSKDDENKMANKKTVNKKKKKLNI